MNKPEMHYESEYFLKYQKPIGEFGGKANLFKFAKHINPNDTVLDFGCGGGFLLNNLMCKEKIGIELNDLPRQFCNDNFKIKCFKTLEEVPNESIDVIISNHCLEHTTSPYELIAQMNKKLKKNGKIILVVPLDNFQYKWKKNDVNYHLYSFSPMNLGNLLDAAGFNEISTSVIFHKWPISYNKIKNIIGWNFFHLVCFSTEELILDGFR